MGAKQKSRGTAATSDFDPLRACAAEAKARHPLIANDLNEASGSQSHFRQRYCPFFAHVLLTGQSKPPDIMDALLARDLDCAKPDLDVVSRSNVQEAGGQPASCRAILV